MFTLFRKKEKLATKFFILIFLAITVLWITVPILLICSNSIKPSLEIKRLPPVVVFKPTLRHYISAISSGEFGLYFKNSFSIAVITTMISVLGGAMGAYGLWLARDSWGNKVSNFILIGKLAPSITILIPFYMLLFFAGLHGSYVGPVLAHCSVNLPFVVWLMLGFIRNIPIGLYESALLDGTSPMRIFWSIYLPLLRPALGSSFILSMQFSWNELLFSLQLTSFSTYTLPVGVARSVGAVAVDWGKGCASATLTMLPIIIVGFIMQKYFVAGMTAGAIKE
jgi:multiple sugar transport system permease protein